MLKIDIVSFTYAGALLSERIKEISGNLPQVSKSYSQKTGITADSADGNLSEFSLECCDIRLFTTNKKAAGQKESISLIEESLSKWCGGEFDSVFALIFIGACGIAVRAISPHLKSKLTDPAVIVIDEKGQNVISLLSGHIGGANELCLVLAKELGANPVITTASDINGKIAVDKWAKDNGLYISDMSAAKTAAAKVVNGERLRLYCDGIIEGNIPEEFIFSGVYPQNRTEEKRVSGNYSSANSRRADCRGLSDLKEPCPGKGFSSGKDNSRQLNIIVSSRICGYKDDLRLIPKNIIIGAGCKKGALYEDLKGHIDELLLKYSIDKRGIAAIASIDLKAGEEAMLKTAEYFKVPFLTFTTDELMSVPGEFTGSDFVYKTTGADNICERAAAAAAGAGYSSGAYFISRKISGKGVTAAILEIPYKVVFSDAPQ